jgi:hypothetical protein
MTWRRELTIIAALVLTTVAVFAPVAGQGFVDFDDGPYVYDNSRVKSGLTWDGIAWAFTTREQSNWHPLTWISHMVDAELFGGEGRVLGLPASGWHHLTSVALHAGSAVLLFLLLWTATGAIGRSAVVAGLFALHPLHVESVAGVSERKDVLSTFLGLGCLLAYVHYARRPSAPRYLVVFALLALGLMAKPMLVTWPFVLLLLDWWPLGRMEPAMPAARRSSRIERFTHLVRSRTPARPCGPCAWRSSTRTAARSRPS